MASALDWSESDYVEWAWSLFAGLLDPESYCFMILSGLFDESEGESGTYVVAGYLIRPSALTALTKEWDPLRRKFGVLDKDDTYQFKYRVLAAPSRRERLAPFYRVMEAHIAGAVAIRFNKLDLVRAMISIGKTIDLKMTTYQFAVRELLGCFHTRRSEFAPPSLETAEVRFIFDNTFDKKGVWAAWDQFVESSPEQSRALFGEAPHFDDDKKLIALQAADFIAGYVRECTERGVDADFSEWRKGAKRSFELLEFWADANDFRLMLTDEAFLNLPPLANPRRK